MTCTSSRASDIRSACFKSRQLQAAFWRGWDAGAEAADNPDEVAPVETSCGDRNPYTSGEDGGVAYHNAWAVGFDFGFLDRRVARRSVAR